MACKSSPSSFAHHITAVTMNECILTDIALTEWEFRSLARGGSGYGHKREMELCQHVKSVQNELLLLQKNDTIIEIKSSKWCEQSYCTQ